MRSGIDGSKRCAPGIAGMSTTIRRMPRSLQKRPMRSSSATARSISYFELSLALATDFSNLADFSSLALKNAQTPLKAIE